MFLVRFAVANPLITNLFLLLVVTIGVMSWKAMPEELFPEIEIDKVSIRTIYEGASPEEVERQITLPIEEEFDGLADIDVIRSTSIEGSSEITIELKPGADVNEFMRDSRTVLDRITDLPDEAEEPELQRVKARFPVISVALFGDVSRGHLIDLSDQVKRRLLTITGVSSANISGYRDWELWVIVDPEKLASSKVPLARVTAALRDNLRDLPGGSIEAREGDILLRGKGVNPDAESVSRLVVGTNANGGNLELGQLAKIERRLEEVRTLGRFNGRPSVNITVTKTTDGSTIDIAQEIKQMVVDLQREFPDNIGIAAFSDLSVYIETRLNTVKSSGIVGLILILLSLYLFLNFRVALVTAMGIPVSFLFAVIFMNYLGQTINMVSMFAFLLAMGMIVDDAIIVTENIYRHMEMGKSPRDAALIGAREVFWPVIAATTTSVAAFLPMFAIGGTMGQFIYVIPIVVSACLIGSLLEAFAVLPSHARQFLHVKARREGGSNGWRVLLERYVVVLHWCLHNRYFVAVATLGVLIVVIIFAVTRMPYIMFGKLDTGQFFVNIEAPNTYSLEKTTELAKRVEKAILEVVDEDKELNSMLTNVGVSFIDFSVFKFGNNYIQHIIDLKKREPEGFIETWFGPIVSLKFDNEGTRLRTTSEVTNAIRARLEGEPGIRRASIVSAQAGPAGADIEVGVAAKTVEGLRTVSVAMRDYLRQLPGVTDVNQDFEPGKLEYQYSLNERGRQLGLTQSQLAEAVRSGFQGLEVTEVTVDGKRMSVRVIYPQAVRTKAADLASLRVVLPSGKSVFLGQVADIEVGRGFNQVNRRDLRRLATVMADVDTDIATPLEVTKLLDKEFASRPDLPDFELLYLGEKREANRSIADMFDALIISLVIIFFILAALFKSLLDPFVVIIAIPFGLIGVVAGHFILGLQLQFLSLIGFLALAGIVVNDSLILIDFIKKRRNEGIERIAAIIDAGRVRTRPILLTSITTFLGVSPLIFFATGQTKILAPMAVSLGFGLLFATVLILLVLPCFYLIADDMRKTVFRFFGRKAPQESSW
ncbi:MAG: cobalt-zinc-cadmium resistance protein [Gammaproteobacteria bacterium]|nr:MAG: cobalt-zinc-cadmium resistance protein [Gammaproteobacteria bacterium]